MPGGQHRLQGFADGVHLMQEGNRHQQRRARLFLDEVGQGVDLGVVDLHAAVVVVGPAVRDLAQLHHGSGGRGSGQGGAAGGLRHEVVGQGVVGLARGVSAASTGILLCVSAGMVR